MGWRSRAVLACVGACAATWLAAPGALAGGEPSVQLTPSTGTITPGKAFSYLVEVTGPADGSMTGTSVSVTAPAGARVVETPAGCEGGGGTVNCGLGTLAPGATANVSVRMAMDPAQGQGTATARAMLECVECAQPVPASASAPVVPEADVTLVLDAPETVAAGQESDYLLHVENLGPSTAAGVDVVDRLPAPLRYAGGDGCSADGRRVTCGLDDLAPGQRATRRLQVTAPDDIGASRQIENAATATAQTTDPDEGNNADTASSDLRDDARLTVTTHTGGAVVTPGEPVTYTTELRGLGPSPAKDIRVESRFPKGVRPAAVVRPSSGCKLAGATVTCQISELAKGATAEVVVRADPDPALHAGKALQTASVSCADCGQPRRNETERRIRPEADLAVTASVDHARLERGDQAVYTVNVTNKGPSNATGLKVVDSLPARLTFVSAKGCAAGGREVTCLLPLLPPGEHRSWQIATRADAKVGQPLSLVSRVHASMAPSIEDADPRTENASVTTVEDPGPTWWPWALGAGVAAVLAVVAVVVLRRRRTASTSSDPTGQGLG